MRHQRARLGRVGRLQADREAVAAVVADHVQQQRQVVVGAGRHLDHKAFQRQPQRLQRAPERGAVVVGDGGQQPVVHVQHQLVRTVGGKVIDRVQQPRQAVQRHQRDVVGGHREQLPRRQAHAIVGIGMDRAFVRHDLAVGQRHQRLEGAGQRAIEELSLHLPARVAPQLPVGQRLARQRFQIALQRVGCAGGFMHAWHGDFLQLTGPRRVLWSGW
ncbi:hypothetical protein D9M69_465660 [compost metagenome]